MMIEGAIRCAKQAIEAWQANDNQRALEAIVRCRKIVSEVMSWIRQDDSELTKQAFGLYLYVFQSLTTAQLRRDAHVAQEVIAVLEIERETWQQVCDEMACSSATVPDRENNGSVAIAPSIVDPNSHLESGSISFDA